MAGSSGSCVLIPGVFGLFVQFCLGCLSLGILGVKYYLESPRRAWGVCCRDVSKQIASALEVHGLNLTAATLFSQHFMLVGGDPCDWYWLNIIVDTTLGVIVNYGLLRLSQRLLNYRSGDYVDSCRSVRLPGSSYQQQLCIWLTIAACMKLCMINFIFIWHRSLLAFTIVVLGPLRDYYRLKLVVVMILTPLTMNVFQYWITDHFLSSRAKIPSSLQLDRSPQQCLTLSPVVNSLSPPRYSPNCAYSGTPRQLTRLLDRATYEANSAPAKPLYDEPCSRENEAPSNTGDCDSVRVLSGALHLVDPEAESVINKYAGAFREGECLLPLSSRTNFGVHKKLHRPSHFVAPVGSAGNIEFSESAVCCSQRRRDEMTPERYLWNNCRNSMLSSGRFDHQENFPRLGVQDR